jgi:hypothetical protein
MKKLMEASVIALAIGAAVLGANVAQASTLIPISPTWDIQDHQLAVGDAFANDYVATISATVQITDLYVPGDNYTVFDNGVLVGSTNAADCTTLTDGCTVFGPYWQADPATAYGLSQFAHFSFFAAAGDTITIRAKSIANGFDDSSVAITQVPEPATWAMLLAGFAGLGLLGYRKSRKLAAA